MPKRTVFVSYHHAGDQAYYDHFSKTFCDRYDLLSDNSLDRRVDSDNADYTIRRIRENYIRGSSCTLVLCGADTPARKYVDWEIKASLDQQAGLVGIKLPTLQVVGTGCAKPARLQDNIDGQYAQWIWWEEIFRDPPSLLSVIELANNAPKSRINNTRELRSRNG